MDPSAEKKTYSSKSSVSEFPEFPGFQGFPGFPGFPGAASTCILSQSGAVFFCTTKCPLRKKFGDVIEVSGKLFQTNVVCDYLLVYSLFTVHNHHWFTRFTMIYL